MVDVGSGKGYLSEHLSVEYGLVVVGVDSEHSNTTGAIERCRKVEKASRGRVDQSSFSAAQLPSSSTHELGMLHHDSRSTEVYCCLNSHSIMQYQHSLYREWR